MPSALQRVKRLEQAMRDRFVSSSECICFPPHERPFYVFRIERLMLERLKCPLHGNRFKPFGLYIFMAAWLIEKLPRLVDRRSEQFRKAWFATFPPELWPAVEERGEDGTIYLILKDGTRLLAEGPLR
jgi:hypothetical protein